MFKPISFKTRRATMKIIIVSNFGWPTMGKLKNLQKKSKYINKNIMNKF